MKQYLYIKLYGPEDKVSNKLLVIGFLRKFFKFKLFIYIQLNEKTIYTTFIRVRNMLFTR